jgi:hypothetical protein
LVAAPIVAPMMVETRATIATRIGVSDALIPVVPASGFESRLTRSR